MPVDAIKANNYFTAKKPVNAIKSQIITSQAGMPVLRKKSCIKSKEKITHAVQV
jgi:hypothetical protein